MINLMMAIYVSEFELQGTVFDTTEHIERLINFGKTYSKDPKSAIYDIFISLMY